ncbi:hypothetical protein T01_4518 [Trichinella spiralis]|uniref:Uncharacterized protein n=1 Tax=Trichinella spiralis TaxID=6334 RepID=A0A0V1B1G8_TRISP|nr:hypothetical protein T01_4518 [Trichinella spiralis]
MLTVEFSDFLQYTLQKSCVSTWTHDTDRYSGSLRMISTRCQQIDPCSSQAGQTFLLFDFFSTALRFVFPKRSTSEQEKINGENFDHHPPSPHSFNSLLLVLEFEFLSSSNAFECCIAQGVLIARGMYNMTARVIWLADESVRFNK